MELCQAIKINVPQASTGKRKRQQKLYSEEIKRQAIELYLSGLTKSKIACELELPESTSRGWIKAFEDKKRHAEYLMKFNSRSENHPRKRKPSNPKKESQVAMDDEEAVAELAEIVENLSILKMLGCKFFGSDRKLEM